MSIGRVRTTCSLWFDEEILIVSHTLIEESLFDAVWRLISYIPPSIMYSVYYSLLILCLPLW